MERNMDRLRERQRRASRHLYVTVGLVLALVIVYAVLFWFAEGWGFGLRMVACLPVAVMAAWVGARERRWQEKNKQEETKKNE